MTCSVAMLRRPRRLGDIRTESMKEAPDEIAICKVRLRAGELPTDVDGSKNGACTDGWIWHGCDAAGLRAATIAAETKGFLPHGRAAGMEMHHHSEIPEVMPQFPRLGNSQRV